MDVDDPSFKMYDAWWGEEIQEEEVVIMVPTHDIMVKDDDGDKAIEVDSDSLSPSPLSVCLIDLDQDLIGPKIGKVILRDEYKEAVNFILSEQRLFINSGGHHSQGVIITGQPGIGQYTSWITVFLTAHPILFRKNLISRGTWLDSVLRASCLLSSLLESKLSSSMRVGFTRQCHNLRTSR